MSRINPLYVVAGLVIVLLLALMQLQGTKEHLSELKGEYSEVKVLSSELVGLKHAYGDAKKSKKSLQRILRASMMKKEKVLSTFTKQGVKITASSIDKKTLNYLMGKILNGAYNITNLKIERLSDTKASINMEIKW